jgi:hypothetical protein
MSFHWCACLHRILNHSKISKEAELWQRFIPQRRAIGEMTKITNDFFDIADTRVNSFSENLGALGSNFI